MAEKTFVESRAEMERVLLDGGIGYLGVSFQGHPYVVPLNYHYSEGKIYFHCALKGRKLDAIAENPEVCFTVGRQMGEVREHAGSTCHVDSESVICYGKARVIEDLEERGKALNLFNRRFRPDAPDIPEERVKNCAVVEITIAEMTGRREQERKRTHWRHSFEEAK
ncbi:MAG TPA: pyridoxamine 5'-phosphate oxidase family protein [Thermodesulfobacteriota bacterium]|nr:pyridoxamine 5'-phosphate oxidase family protein [Thermodesulfobacteriota bacterium]